MLLEICQPTRLAAAEILLDSGHTGVDITVTLSDSYQSAIDEVSSILRIMGFSDTLVVAGILTDAGYPANTSSPGSAPATDILA